MQEIKGRSEYDRRANVMSDKKTGVNGPRGGGHEYLFR